MRLFVAAYPPPEAVDHLRTVVDALALSRQVRERPPRLSPPEQWHVTLAFLGDVPGGGESAGRALSRVAARAAPFHVRLAGGGTFGADRWTVVWAGLRGDLISLGGLADDVRQALTEEHLPYDPRKFRPHLTLARAADRVPPDLLAGDLARLEAYEGPRWTVGEMVLVESRPGNPPRYVPVATFPLG